MQRLEQWTLEQVEQLRRSIIGLAESNPERQQVESRIQSMQAFLDNYRSGQNESVLKSLVESRTYELDAEVIRARSGLEAYGRELARMSALRDMATKEASRVSASISHSRDDLFRWANCANGYLL